VAKSPSIFAAAQQSTAAATKATDAWMYDEKITGYRNIYGSDHSGSRRFGIYAANG
jgi:hypothetical protein